MMFYVKNTLWNDYFIEFEGVITSWWACETGNAQSFKSYDTALVILKECLKRHRTNDYVIVELKDGFEICKC